jgi:hypothetical protein
MRLLHRTDILTLTFSTPLIFNLGSDNNRRGWFDSSVQYKSYNLTRNYLVEFVTSFNIITYFGRIFRIKTQKKIHVHVSLLCLTLIHLKNCNIL